MKNLLASLLTLAVVAVLGFGTVGCSKTTPAAKDTVKDTVKDTAKDTVKDTVKDTAGKDSAVKKDKNP